MSPTFEIAGMILLFLIRLGIPLAVTILVAWGLRRLDARWQAEADAQQLTADVAIGLVAPAAVKAPAARQQPCWENRHCSEAKRSSCAACAMTDLPCWMARLRSEGRLPGNCYGCQYFKVKPASVGITVGAAD